MRKFIKIIEHKKSAKIFIMMTLIILGFVVEKLHLSKWVMKAGGVVHAAAPDCSNECPNSDCAGTGCGNGACSSS